MQAPPRKRPQLLDQEVLECIAGRLFPDVKNWLEDSGEVLTDRDERDVFDALVELLHHHEGLWDGYALARYLEDQKWAPDARLVEILHDATRISDHSLREETIRWVHELGLKPQYRVGAFVKFKLYENEPPLEGQVVEVTPETLEFAVQVNDATVLIAQEAIVQD